MRAESSAETKQAGLARLAEFLLRSKRMVILFSEDYFFRFELSARLFEYCDMRAIIQALVRL